jgi:hypothetical protein
MNPTPLRTAILLAALALPTALRAQNYQVFPSDHTTVEGYSYESGFPFAFGVARCMAVYSVWDLQIPNGAMITKVGIRPDEAASATGHRIQLEILMGHTDKELSQLDRTFDNNFLATPVTVFRQQIVQLPNLTASTPGPQTTPVLITLDTPFQYQAGYSLIVDYRVYANDNGNQSFTYPVDLTNFYSDKQSFGTGCQTSTSTTPTLTTSGAQLGGYWSIYATDCLAYAPALVLVGRNNTNHMGVPLPFDMGPLGAPGCNIYVEFVMALPTAMNSSGRHTARFTIPKMIGLYGIPVFGQYLIGDPFANNLGVVSTNGVSATLGIASQMSYIYRRGDATATSGSVYQERGQVSVIEYQ